jgi:DNA topoisomerase VI subunit B
MEHIKCVPLIPTTDELKKLKFTRSQVQLLPGVNEVTDDEWKILEVHLVREIKRREIIKIEKDVPKSNRAPSGKAKNLKEFPSSKAVVLVNECVNPDTLKKWYQEETREEVRLAIVEKMKELNIEIPKFKGLEVTGEEELEKTEDTPPPADQKDKK